MKRLNDGDSVRTKVLARHGYCYNNCRLRVQSKVGMGILCTNTSARVRQDADEEREKHYPKL